jgi:hypothetical protein
MSFEKYLNSAKGYFHGLQVLTSNLQQNTVDPIGLLASQSIELSLKAYLLYVGWNEKQLKKIGHDLVEAWTNARKNDLPISKEPAFSIQLLSLSHDAPYLFRYPKGKAVTAIPSPDQLCREIGNLIYIVENEIAKKC